MSDEKKKWTYKILNEKVSPVTRLANQAKLRATLANKKMRYEFLNSQGKVCCKSDSISGLCTDCKIRARLSNGQTVQTEMKLNSGGSNVCKCQKCGGIKPNVQVQKQEPLKPDPVRLAKMMVGKPNLSISLDEKDRTYLHTDKNGNVDYVNRDEVIPAPKVSESIRANSEKKVSSEYERYLEGRNARNSNSEMIEPLKVSERIKAMREGTIPTVKPDDSNPNEAPPVLSVMDRIKANRAKK